MRLLLHVCCAPCAIEPVQRSREDGFEITGFFCNPNIHPFSEYSRRKKEVEAYFRSENLKLVSEERNAADFFKSVTEDNAPPGRCRICWNIRLERGFSFAEKNGFDSFTTTLLGSPYQGHEALKDICEALSEKSRVNFYYKDFRAGFRQAHNLARHRRMYCQNYCGCVFSMVEREERKSAKKQCTISVNR